MRPPGSYTPLEAEQGLVRPNYQSGIFGGITLDQVSAIRAVEGIEVAAPVANIGYVDFGGRVEVPMQRYLNGDDQQLFRIRPTWAMDRGTSRFVGAPYYVYVSRNSTTVLPRVRYQRRSAFGWGDQPAYAEVVPGRADPVPVCTNYEHDKDATRLETGRAPGSFGYRDPYSPGGPFFSCFYLDTVPADLANAPEGAEDPRRLTARLSVPMPVLVAAIDPEAEAALWGLDRAVVAGRMLTPGDVVTTDPDGNPVMPMVIASSVDVDQQLSATVERVAAPGGRMLSDALSGEDDLVGRVAALPGTPVAEVGPIESAKFWADENDRRLAESYGNAVDNYYTVGPSTYDDRGSDGELTVRPAQNPEEVYQSGLVGGLAPVGSDDAAVRPVLGHPNAMARSVPGIGLVGEFDPSKAAGTEDLSGLTAETYVSPLLPGADPASQEALGNQPLAPSSNLGGYAAQRPSLLTTFAGAEPLLQSSNFRGASSRAPVSVVRVRVRGVEGPDPVSRERLNLAATAIAQRTGLAVDVVAGASGVPTTVVLPAGQHGRPELRLVETWARKGVAYEVIDAVDRKSAALFALILATCALVVGNAAAAAVRTRRTELGVLSGLGWSAGRLFGDGPAGAGGGRPSRRHPGRSRGRSAWPASPASRSTRGRAALAVPVAVGLAALAGLGPAFRAARAAPVDAVRPLLWTPRRVRPVRSLAGMSLASLRRIPGRTLLAPPPLGHRRDSRDSCCWSVSARSSGGRWSAPCSGTRWPLCAQPRPLSRWWRSGCSAPSPSPTCSTWPSGSRLSSWRCCGAADGGGAGFGPAGARPRGPGSALLGSLGGGGARRRG